MKRLAHRITILGIIANTFLFLLKIIFGILSNSIALISDAVNSFIDIIGSATVYICVKKAAVKPDVEHPFGHQRIEPIAGLVVAILAGILGFQVIKTAVERIIMAEKLAFGIIPIVVLLFTMIIKVFMAIYYSKVGKKLNSPAILAYAVDYRNDIFLSLAAIVGIAGALKGYAFFDPAAAIIIGLWVIKSGYGIGKENIDYLIGKAPSNRLISLIKDKALSVKYVKGLNDVKAHYVGPYVHVEVHIEVDKNLSTLRSHKIGKEVQAAVEKIPSISRAFIHIDPR